jgi:hypothetical protein
MSVIYSWHLVLRHVFLLLRLLGRVHTRLLWSNTCPCDAREYISLCNFQDLFDGQGRVCRSGIHHWQLDRQIPSLGTGYHMNRRPCRMPGDAMHTLDEVYNE